MKKLSQYENIHLKVEKSLALSLLHLQTVRFWKQVFSSAVMSGLAPQL